MWYLVFLLIIGCDDVLSRRHDDLLVEVLHELRVTKSREELHLLHDLVFWAKFLLNCESMDQ